MESRDESDRATTEAGIAVQRREEAAVGYRITSRDYLERANTLLVKGSVPELFYAAFELRCGVQQRLSEYADAHDEVEDLKRRGWRIPSLAKAVEALFRSGDGIVEIQMQDGQGSPRFSLFYTPVTADLRSRVGRLDEYLHAVSEYRASSDPWWAKMRADLDAVRDGLRLATSGTLLGPPLTRDVVGGKPRSFRFVCEGGTPGLSDDELRTLVGRTGERRRMAVRRHAQPPPTLFETHTRLFPRGRS